MLLWGTCLWHCMLPLHTPTAALTIVPTVPQPGAEPVLLEPLPALLSCVRRLAALQAPDCGSQGDGVGGGLADESDATTLSIGMASQLMRIDLGCESSKALQVCSCNG